MAFKAISTTAATLRRWPAPGQWTYQDYLELPDDGYRYEIIWGELYMTPAPGIGHQKTSGELEYLLRSFVKSNNLGTVLDAPCDVILEPGGTPVEPDILFISKEREAIIGEKNINGAPDLIIEILSPSNPEHDRQRKFKLYQESGVAEYWIVDSEARVIEVFALQDSRYLLVGRFGSGRRATSQLLAGFSVAVDEVISQKI